MTELDQELANFSIKVQVVNVLGVLGHIISVATTELTNWHECVPLQLCLKKQAMEHSLLTPGLG